MSTPTINGAIVRVGLLVVLGVSLVTAGTVLWNHYSGLVETKATLAARVSNLEGSLATEQQRSKGLEEAIDRWNMASEAQVVALQEFTEVQREAAAYSKELKNVFSKHDLGALAKRKPALVESRINAGSASAFRMLERASDSAPGASSDSPAAPNPRAASPDSGKPD